MAFISRPLPSNTKHAKKTWLSFLRRMECIWQTSKICGKMEKLQISDPTIISSWLFLPVYPMSTVTNLNTMWYFYHLQWPFWTRFERQRVEIDDFPCLRRRWRGCSKPPCVVEAPGAPMGCRGGDRGRESEQSDVWNTMTHILSPYYILYIYIYIHIM